MVSRDVACAGSAQVVDAHERARAYEIAAYLSAASFPFDTADGPPANPVPSTDVALNALVQHGTHALECDRAFLSFIDDRSQFICAEMTRHQSIVDTGPNHSLLLGTTKIALDWGVCPYTMSVFHGKAVTLPESPYIVANEDYFCIKNFRKIPDFAARPFVAGYPHMISYMEVPLRSLSGYILGSYCVVDDKERDFLNPDALRTIQESALAVNQYLDLKRTERSRMRSERVMGGLCQFIGSHKPNTASPFSLDIFEDVSRPGSESRGNEITEPDGVPNNPLVPNVDLGVLSRSIPDFSPDDSEATTVSPRKGDVAKGAEPSMSARVNELLSGAANMIGHAMNLDAFVFFDAVDTGTRYREGRQSSSFTNKDSPTPVDEKIPSSAQPLSEYLDDASAASAMVCPLSQSLIRRLTVAYPLGHLFTIDEYGVLEHGIQKARPRLSASGTTTVHDDWQELFDCIPTARYAIFLPLWHYQRESSYLNCLAWVSDPGKTLEANDINSLTAFGNSLMAEIFRLEAATSTQQKSDFVSSVSHELRSPLHGILATVELMQENTLDSRLLSMTQMIESCSHTLLDTFDHLLEFSKINSLQEGKESATRAKSDNDGPSTQKLATDLGSVVEDVLQAVSLGHDSVSQMQLALKREHQDPLASEVEIPPLPILITTYVDHNHSWSLRMDPGIWKRILLNIFSNALRFTISGQIDVTLRMIEGTDVDPRYTSLSVADSGVGMSREFLKYHLFTPFMQEDNLVSGTGLGLHIVKNLVESLDGKLFVESRQYEGTRVTVNIPYDKAVEASGQPDAVGSPAPYEKTSNLTIGIINTVSQKTPNTQAAPCITTPPKLLQRCLRNICETVFGMRVVDDLPLDELLEKDVVLLDTHELISTEMLQFEQQFPQVISAMASRPFIVLGSTAKGVGQFFKDRGAIFISSPITRKSMWGAITDALNQDGHSKAASSRTLGVDNRDLSRRIDPSYPRGSSSEAGVTVARSKSLDLPMRSVSSLHDAVTKQGSSSTLSPQVSSPSQSRCTIVADCPQPPSIYRFKRLLLVDDNPINLKLLAAFAKRTGLPFATAFDGAEAVRLYKKAVLEENDPFDFVFMDLSMPVMDGFQATAAIRQFEEQQRKEHQNCIANARGSQPSGDDSGQQQCATVVRAFSSNIVALTGLGSEEARSMARDSGFDLFLVKPVKFKNLEPLLKGSTINGKI